MRRDKPLKRTAGPKRTGGLKRTGGPKAKPKPPLPPEERVRAHDWWVAVAKGKPCVVCRSTRGVQAHHVIEKQVVKRAGGDVWDKRNGIALCVRDHERHTSAYRRVPRYLVPAAAWEFARELRLERLIKDQYPCV